ncbi:hypothetical protein OKW43_004317 [Paraburkholderia sp. WC7.3g]
MPLVNKDTLRHLDLSLKSLKIAGQGNGSRRTVRPAPFAQVSRCNGNRLPPLTYLPNRARFRDDQDQLAVESHQRAGRAIQDGRFSEQIVPVALHTKKGETVFDTDEHVLPGTTAADLSVPERRHGHGRQRVRSQ